MEFAVKIKDEPLDDVADEMHEENGVDFLQQIEAHNDWCGTQTIKTEVNGDFDIVDEQVDIITVSAAEMQAEDERIFMKGFEQQNHLPNSMLVSKEKRCVVCSQHFTKHAAYEEHLEFHRQNRFFCTFKCGCHFESIEQCAVHEFETHKLRFMQCNVCNHKLTSSATYTQHLQEHAKLVRYTCSYCRVWFTSCWELYEHWQQQPMDCGLLMQTCTQNMGIKNRQREPSLLRYRLKSTLTRKNCATTITTANAAATTTKQATKRKRSSDLNSNMAHKPVVKNEHTLDVNADKDINIVATDMVEVKQEPLDEDFDIVEPTIEIKEEPICELDEYDTQPQVEIKTESLIPTSQLRPHDALKTLHLLPPSLKIVPMQATNSKPSITPTTPLNMQHLKIVKLSPNAKIIRLSPSSSAQTSAKEATTTTQNKPTIFLKLANNASLLKTQANGTRMQTFLNKNNVTLTRVNVDTTANASNIKQESSDVEELIAQTKKADEYERKQRLSRDALSAIDRMPQKREIISNLIQQIQNIAQDKPCELLKLPDVPDIEPEQSDTEKVLRTTTEEPTQQSNEDCLQTPQTKESIAAVDDTVDEDSNDDITPPPTFYLSVLSDAPELLEARKRYKNYRFAWMCPHCPRQYGQKHAFCGHLVSTHGMCKEEFDQQRIEVRPFKYVRNLVESTKTKSSKTKTPLVGADNTPIAKQMSTPEVEPIKMSALKGRRKSNADSNTSSSSSSSSNRYLCINCGRVCSSKVMLNDHIRANCSREPQYPCTVCPKRFYSASTLNCHLTIHTGVLPHKCNYCDKRFRTRGQVTVHHRTHTGERPFKCQVCSQGFTHRETLISHLSRHIGMKRYKCYGCNKHFSCISGLKTHRDIRPDSCGKVKFNPRALGPRVRVVKGQVIFESQPDINPYLRSEDPQEVLSEIQNQQN